MLIFLFLFISVLQKHKIRMKNLFFKILYRLYDLLSIPQLLVFNKNKIEWLMIEQNKSNIIFCDRFVRFLIKLYSFNSYIFSKYLLYSLISHLKKFAKAQSEDGKNCRNHYQNVILFYTAIVSIIRNTICYEVLTSDFIKKVSPSVAFFLYWLISKQKVGSTRIYNKYLTQIYYPNPNSACASVLTNILNVFFK